MHSNNNNNKHREAEQCKWRVVQEKREILDTVRAQATPGTPRLHATSPRAGRATAGSVRR